MPPYVQSIGFRINPWYHPLFDVKSAFFFNNEPYRYFFMVQAKKIISAEEFLRKEKDKTESIEAELSKLVACKQFFFLAVIWGFLLNCFLHKWIQLRQCY